MEVNRVNFKGFFYWWFNTVNGRNLTIDELRIVRKKYEDEI